MPFQSKRQMRWAFATRQPFARRWARATRAPKRLPERARKAFTLDELELAVTKSLDPLFIELIADRVPELAAFKGEQLAPGVTRIRGDLCNVHGKYGSCSEAGFGSDTSAADTIAQNKRQPTRAPGRGRGRKPAAPKQTPEERAAARESQRTQQRDRTLGQALDRSQAETLTKLSTGESLADDGGLVAQGLAERGRDGTIRLTARGRQTVSAAERGDAAGVRDTLSLARDQVATQGERDAKRESKRQQQATAKLQREAERQMRRQQAGKRGSGGSRSRQADRQQREQQAEQRRAQQEAKREGERQQREAQRAADRTQRAAEQAKREAARQQAATERSRVTTPELAATARQLSTGNQLNEQDAQSLIRNGLARLSGGNLTLTATGLRATRQKERFAVFKDAAGRYRWISTSSNAYRDRDEEIVSTKALSGAVALADATGYRGPLRFWHVPGFDIGDCDYQAVTGNGRWLVESGTFRDEAIGQCIAEKARDWQTSIGFTHAIGEPDASGVFDHIAIFERSITPPGRAANPFTHFVVKERTMDQAKLAEAVKLFGPEKVKELLAQIETKDASAQAAGVAFKAEEPTTPDETIVLNGVTYVREKAPPPAPGEAAPPAEVPAEAMTEEPMIEEGDAVEEGLTLSPDDLQAIGDLIGSALQSALAPLVGVMEIDKTMGARMDEIKSMLGGYSAKKDDEQATVKAQIDELSSRLKQAQDRLTELAGAQPERQAGYRPSQADDTVIPTEALPEVTKAIKPSAAQAHPFADVVQGLFGPAEVV